MATDSKQEKEKSLTDDVIETTINHVVRPFVKAYVDRIPLEFLQESQDVIDLVSKAMPFLSVMVARLVPENLRGNITDILRNEIASAVSHTLREQLKNAVKENGKSSSSDQGRASTPEEREEYTQNAACLQNKLSKLVFPARKKRLSDRIKELDFHTRTRVVKTLKDMEKDQLINLADSDEVSWAAFVAVHDPYHMENELLTKLDQKFDKFLSVDQAVRMKTRVRQVIGEHRDDIWQAILKMHKERLEELALEQEDDWVDFLSWFEDIPTKEDKEGSLPGTQIFAWLKKKAKEVDQRVASMFGDTEEMRERHEQNMERIRQRRNAK